MRKETRALLAVLLLVTSTLCAAFEIKEYPVPKGAHPHDVAPAADGGVWYTAQHQGALGYLDPKTGKTRHIPLGNGSRPHGVIVGPDGAAWITDSGLNANRARRPENRQGRSLPAAQGHAERQPQHRHVR